MQVDGAQWPLPLHCLSRIFDIGFSFHGSFLLCRFCDYEVVLGFLGMVLQGLDLELQSGMGMKKIKVHTCIHSQMKKHLQSALEV